MMIVSPTPVFRWTDNNGNPAVGWQVETYIAGSSTPVDTYTDATGTAENTNPIILDARGEANIWLDPAISYKYVIKNSLGVVQDTIDQIQAGSGGSGGLTRVYYNDSSSIAFSGLGTLATPLSSAVKLSAYPNNALQIRPDGLYAVAIGGGGSVAWGAITGDITDQTDLINKFGEYLPLAFSSPQIVTYTGEGQYVFADAGEFVAQNLAVGSAQNNFVSLKPFDLSVRFVDGVNAYDSKLTLATLTAGRTWTLPDASGTIALTSTLGDYIKRDGTTPTTATIPFALGIDVDGKSTFFAGVTQTGWVGFDSGAFNVVSVGIPLTLTSPDVINYNATTHHVLKWNGTTTPPTGTQAYLLGIDSNGNLIQGSAGSGFVTISGHNDLTTPWSIGDGTTYALSNGGIKIDPGGAFGIEMKGNVQIEQAVSQALNLYRPVSSGDICLVFRAWDSLGTASDYAQVCGRIVTNTAGNLSGALDFEVMVNGTMQTPMTLSNTGTVLSLHTSVSGSQISLRSSDTGVGGWRMGIRSTAAGEWVLVNDNLTTIPLIVSRTDDSFTFAGAVLTSASTTTRAGLRIPHGTAPTSPVNGDVWSTTTAWLVRTNGATQTIAMLENAQTFSGVKTFSATPVISSTTASTTAGAIYRTANVGLIGYEFGMAQRLQSTIYRAPVGTALTNSVTETDVNGGTAVFGTRTLSNSAMQIGAVVLVFARIKYTNTAANTLTLRLRWSTIAGTILATAVLTRVNAGAEVFDLVFRGIAQVAPSATSATSWSCGVQGQSLIATNATTTSTEATLATSTATPLILSAQWTSALATSSVQVLNSYISVE